MRPDLYGSALPYSFQEFGSFLCSTSVQLFLGYPILQPSAFRLCIPLADRALDIHFMDDRILPESGQTGCMDADSISCLGRICGVSEPWRLAAESIDGFVLYAIVGKFFLEISMDGSANAVLQGESAGVIIKDNNWKERVLALYQGAPLYSLCSSSASAIPSNR